MTEFLIGCGLVLLLALLGWSDNIISWHRDTIDFEKSFFQERNIEWRQIRNLVRDNVAISQKLLSLSELLKKDSLKEGDALIIDKLSTLDSERCRLESLYKIKYTLIIILTFLFFITGVISLFIKECHYIKFFGIPIQSEYLPMLFCVVISLGVLCFLIYINKSESSYISILIKLQDQI